MSKKQKIPHLTFIFLAITLLGLSAGILATKNTLQTRSKAEEITPTPADCASDTQREDYCGDSAPFRGCNGGGEWFCQCRLPDKKWWSECSVIEDSTGKQKRVTQCGGDQNKALLQWKYDVALSETGGKCSCGGQNICGSLVPTKGPPANVPPAQKPVWPTQFPVENVVLTPLPTSIPVVPTRQIIPPTIYIPPTSPPIINPTSTPQVGSENLPVSTLTLTPTSIPRPVVHINFDAVNKFFEEAKKSIVEFLSQVLP